MSIFVSLTTTSHRLAVVRYVLLSLQHQELRPDRIFLNISTEPYLYDEGISELPPWLVEMEKDILTVNWTPNTGSYRKLIPVVTDIDDSDILVTCDDDVIYAPQWLEKLTGEAEANPDCIICACARKPVKNIFGRTQSYVNWNHVQGGEKGLMNVPIGFGGIAYRKRLLDLEFLFLPDYRTAAPKQDDLWFKMASFRKGREVYVIPEANAMVNKIKTRNSLSDTNLKSIYVSSKKVLNFFSRRIVKVMAYTGFTVCGNDRAWKQVQRISKGMSV